MYSWFHGSGPAVFDEAFITLKVPCLPLSCREGNQWFGRREQHISTTFRRTCSGSVRASSAYVLVSRGKRSGATSQPAWCLLLALAGGSAATAGCCLCYSAAFPALKLRKVPHFAMVLVQSVVLFVIFPHASHYAIRSH